MIKINEFTYEIEMKDIRNIVAQRPSDTNKGDYGYVGIMGGCLEYSGAVKLANLSAASMRAGCGVVRLIIPKEIAKSVTPYLLEQTIFPMEDNDSKMVFSREQLKEALNKLKAVAIGMGWGKSEEYKKILEYILINYQIPIVIDADGLNTLSTMNMDILKETKCKVILTPHLKEFERLSKIKLEDIRKVASSYVSFDSERRTAQGNLNLFNTEKSSDSSDTIKNHEINLAKDFAKTYNVILLLKGPTTIVTDGEKVYLVKRGCSGMATAGSGDVLSGILAGLLGYNVPDLLTVSAGAFLNGVAGEIAEEKYTDISMIASDTVKCLPEAIKQIRNLK